MPSYEINIKTTDDPRGIQNATDETVKLTDAMGKLLERAKKKDEYAAAKEALAGMTQEEREAALAAYQLESANGKLHGGLTNLEKAVAGTRSTIGGLNSDIKVLGMNLGTSADLLNGLGVSIPISPMQLFGTAIKTTGEYLHGAITDYTAYVEEVDRISTFSGMASEETSRLIQVGDDLRIEVKTIEMALKTMADRGTTPSIEGLAQLSDRFLAIQDPLQRAQFLTDNFSRSGIEMARIMELGSGKIRTLTDEVEHYMVVTGKSKEEAEAYLLAQDSLGDSWAGLKYQVAEGLIPILTDLINTLVRSSDEIETGGAQWMRYVPVLSQVRSGYIGIKNLIDESTGSVQAQTEEINKMGNSWLNAAQNAEIYANRAPAYTVYYGPNANFGEQIDRPAPGRAAGGSVTAGQLYAINENRPWNGPEYFLAPADGMILPSGAAAQQALRGNQQIIQVNLNYSPAVSLADRYEAEQVLVPYIEAALRKRQ